ncbi:transcription initiation factor TFIID subunit 11-like protein [Labeo rohita]|nr:transcription initiation factor TFIID subunit 11-like protein [Labeo rohita]
MQSNRSSLSVPIEMNDTPTALTETTDIRHEQISTALDEDGPGSLSYMSDNLFSFGTTSNLMEEIFSGTEWAQFLSVNRNKPDQSNESPNTISREEELHSKWTGDKDDLHLGLTQPSLPESFTQHMSTHPTEMSQMSLTNPLQTFDPFINQQQNRNPGESHSREQSNEHPQFYQLVPNESKVTEHSDQHGTSSQVYDPSHNQPQGGMEDYIPVLDLSYAKPIKRQSVTSHGSISRKREHWTKRRESFEPTTQDMEDEEHGGSFTAPQFSNPVHSPSPASSLNSILDSVSEDSEYEVLETAVKKRRMEDTRRVRFCEQVIVLPPSYLSESDEDNVDEEIENDLQEEASPRSSFPRWMVSLKPKSGKYKF